MLRPEITPEPLKPLETPIADYELPRALQDFDFGPKPIQGVSTTMVPSMGSVLAGAAGAGFSAYAANTAGTNNFQQPTNTTPYSTEGFGGLSFADAVNMPSYLDYKP